MGIIALGAAFSNIIGRTVRGAVLSPWWAARGLWRASGAIMDFGEKPIPGMIRNAVYRPYDRMATGIENAVFRAPLRAYNMAVGSPLSPHTSYTGVGGKGRWAFQATAGLGLGVGVGVYNMYEGFFPDPPTVAAPYPGTTAMPPIRAMDNLAADGDLAFALHENYGSGKYL